MTAAPLVPPSHLTYPMGMAWPPGRPTGTFPITATHQALYAGLSALELHDLVDGLTHERLAVRETGGDPTYLALIDWHLDGPVRELERRTRRHAAGAGPDPRPAYTGDLIAIAARVRRTVDIRHPLDLHGWVPARASQSGEFAGPCPFCPDGGHDRFVVWPATAGRDGRVWCRRCAYSADVIGLYRDLEHERFPAALTYLSALAGIVPPRPDPGAARIVLANARRAQRPA